ncbi:MAG: hypothetical protein J6Y90_06470 [Lachnospiraceae bacterium]|nr:hypothetical protein [Lachnospiraceae bacterium]
MIENFLASLQVMGLGMLGIFAVARILFIIMKLLTHFFPADKKDDNKGQ